MSLQDGMAALNLEMPDRVPRTEYSAEKHWDLIKAVLKTDVVICPRLKKGKRQVLLL